MRRLRAREAESLMAAAPDPGLGAVTEVVLLGPALESGIEAMGLGPADAALAQLARLTAQLIDSAANPPLALAKLGPLLLKLLVLLDGRRPAPARPERGPNRVRQMRAARAAEDARRRGRGRG